MVPKCSTQVLSIETYNDDQIPNSFKMYLQFITDNSYKLEKNFSLEIYV